MNNQALISAIITTDAVSYGKCKLRSGRISDFYIDLSKLTYSPFLKVLANDIHRVIKDINFDSIGGPSTGINTLIGAYLAISWQPKRGFLVRKDDITGAIRKGDKCIIIEDVAETGNSLLQAITAVEAFGAIVVHALTVVDRTGEVQSILNARGISFTSLLTLKDLKIR